MQSTDCSHRGPTAFPNRWVSTTKDSKLFGSKIVYSGNIVFYAISYFPLLAARLQQGTQVSAGHRRLHMPHGVRRVRDVGSGWLMFSFAKADVNLSISEPIVYHCVWRHWKFECFWLHVLVVDLMGQKCTGPELFNADQYKRFIEEVWKRGNLVLKSEISFCRFALVCIGIGFDVTEQACIVGALEWASAWTCQGASRKERAIFAACRHPPSFSRKIYESKLLVQRLICPIH